MAVKKTTQSKKQVTTNGRVYITSGFNNTLITVTDPEGNMLFSGSAGRSGFRGSRKSTPYAATMAAQAVATEAKNAGMQEVSVYVNGPGAGRISAIKALKVAGLKVSLISDITKIPHNGCRPKKRRRV